MNGGIFLNAREKWNRKYEEKFQHLERLEANQRLKQLSSYFQGGKALDLACGLGSNSLYLATWGYEVDAFDLSDIALNYLREEKEKRNLPIHLYQTDLANVDELQLKQNAYDLVIDTYYLNRSLFPLIKEAVKPNGYFFMETYYLSEQADTHVSDRYKLQSNELLREFSDWMILFFEEHEQEGRQTIFCKKPFS